MCMKGVELFGDGKRRSPPMARAVGTERRAVQTMKSMENVQRVHRKASTIIHYLDAHPAIHTRAHLPRIYALH